MKRLSTILSSTLFGLSFATSGASAEGVNAGDSLTLGSMPQGYSIFSARQNSANASLVIAEDERFRMNYLPALSVGTELGNVNNFIDEVDDLIDILEDASSVDDADETLDRFNNVLEQLGDEGYLQVDVRFVAPALPLFFRPGIFDGTVYFELENLTQIRTSILDKELTYDNQNGSFATSTSAYIKAGNQTQFSVGYSKEGIAEGLTKQYGGKLLLGAKLNVYRVELSKQVVLLQQLDGQGIEDYAEDEFDNNLESSTNIGVDIGATWVADKYNLGLVIRNINAPSFNFKAIGVDCEQFEDASLEQTNCEVTRSEFASEISLRETHKKYASATVSGNYFINKRWTVGGSLDLAKYDDLVATEKQWMNIAMAYYPKHSYAPSLRVGYQKNLAGSKISSISAGLSFFQRLSIDVQMALDDITIDGSSGPRSTAISLAFTEKF